MTESPLQQSLDLSSVEDFVKPSECQHVIVNLKRAPTEEGKKKKKKRSWSISSSSSSTSSYCVMCGETVSEKDKEKDKTKGKQDVDDILTSRRIATTARTDMATGKNSRSKPGLVLERQDSSSKLFQTSVRRSTACLNTPSTQQQSQAHCARHNHKKIKYFCEDHQEIGCSVCVSVLHRKCDRVMFIRDEIEAGWDKSVSSATLEALILVEKSFEEILENNRIIRDSLVEQVEQVRKKREDLRAYLLELLNEFDKTSDKMMDKFCKIAEKDVKSNIDTCEVALKDVRQSYEMLNMALTSESQNSLFIATQKALEQKEKYALALSEAVTNTKTLYIDFQPEVDIPNIEELQKIGTIHFTAEEKVFPESVISSVSKLPKNELRSPRTIDDAFTQCSDTTTDAEPANIVGKYNTRLDEDKETCENIGTAFLEDGRVAIADSRNLKIKVFDLKFTKSSCLQLSSKPRAITVVGPREVAITLPDESKIQILTVGKKVRLKCSILTSIPCYGIAHHAQTLVALCKDGFSTMEIQVMDLSGDVKKKIPLNEANSTVLKKPLDLTLNPDGQHTWLTDENRVICIGLDGSVAVEYTDSDLKSARGVVTDDVGRVYVCGSGSNNVHQVSHNGRKLQVVVSGKEIRAPQSVCFCSEKRLLLVTESESDVVSIFKLAKS